MSEHRVEAHALDGSMVAIEYGARYDCATQRCDVDCPYLTEQEIIALTVEQWMEIHENVLTRGTAPEFIVIATPDGTEHAANLVTRHVRYDPWKKAL